MLIVEDFVRHIYAYAYLKCVSNQYTHAICLFPNYFAEIAGLFFLASEKKHQSDVFSK